MSKSQNSSRVNRSTYDRLSRWYDLLAAGSERRAQTAGLDLLGVEQGEIVLEIGSGTGQALLKLARSVGSLGMVIGFDLSAGMISQAAAKLRKAALADRTVLVRGDAIHLPFQSEFCDAVFMSFTLELFPTREIPSVLSECQRVLKSDGLLCAVAMAEKADPAPITRAYEWAHKRFPAIIDCRPIDVQNFVSQAGFQIQATAEIGLWGLPIQILKAGKR